MNISATWLLRSLRIVVLGCVPLLAACSGPFAQSTKSPPRVDVPEPGGARATVGAPPAAQGAARARPSYPSSAQSHPATSARASPPPPAVSALPIPGPGSAAGEDSFTIESADESASPAPGGPDNQPVAAPAPSGNSAVNTLLAQAATERRGGNLDAAIAAAERALRIAPADPAVYCELATLRLERGDLALAEQLARKGLSYAPDAELQQRLGAIIERARRGMSG